MGIAEYAQHCFESGQRRSTRYLETLKTQSLPSWRREVRLRYLDRLLATQDPESPIYAQTLEEWRAMREYTTATLTQEMWLTRKLYEISGVLLTVNGEIADRKQKLREFIAARSLGDKSCGKRKGVDTTFAQLFAVIYEEAL